MILLLAGCERDPSLLGYWDITTMRAGSDADTAEEASLAGFVEFQSNGAAYAMFSYTWTGTWTPDPAPALVTFETDARERDDFVETYKTKDETYTVSMTTKGWTNVYDVLDWEGNTVRLSSAAAAPPGRWEGDSLVYFELELER